ncbi:MAG: Gfo/Idh/MocA family oxidoreductase [Cyclobacteriaceae bacterium]|nr:Gfo/Idh/MocA family oxidoreductase [Cyclobacteriaceae bacterium]
MKRRNFLVSSLLGTVGLNLSSCHSKDSGNSLVVEQDSMKVPEYKSTPLAAGKSVSGSNDKIILSLIGAGGWGSNLALEMSSLNANTEFKYVCDVDDTRGGRVIDELGKIQGYNPERIRDMRRIFDDRDVDAVIIATPTHWHTLASLRAMQAGKDVYLEKCITHNVHEGQQLAHAAAKYDRILQCGLQNRSAAYNGQAAEYVKSGKLGKILNVSVIGFLNGPVPLNEKPEESAPDYIDWDMWLGPAAMAPYSISRNKSWHYYWEYSAGMCMEDGIHQMDLMRYVMGNPGVPRSVSTVGGRFSVDDRREIPDVLNVVYDFRDYTINFQAGEFCRYMIKTSPEIRYSDQFPDWTTNSSKVIIQGTEAMMILGRMGGGWQIYGNEGEMIEQIPGRFPLQDNLRNYLDCIRSRNVPNANIVQGHLSSSMLHYANLSLRLGNHRLEIDPETEFIKNNPEANRIATGHYREGFQLPEIV